MRRPFLADSVDKVSNCGAEISVSQSVPVAGLKVMMAHRQVEQAALFYEFSVEKHIPADHLLRSIDRVVDLEDLRRELGPSTLISARCLWSRTTNLRRWYEQM